MASIETRERTQGHVYRVVWRQDGRKQVETFSAADDAAHFRVDVDAAGQRWPEGWLRGIGYSEAEPVANGKPETAAPAAPLVTLLDYALAYTDSRRTKAQPEHRMKMRRQFRAHLGTLGDLTLGSVTGADVQTWVDDLVADGYSYKSVKNWRSDVSSVHKAAIADRLVTFNPVLGTTIDADPNAGRAPRFLAVYEFDAIVAAMAPEHRVYIETLARTGMRKGEAAALRVGDLDLGARPAVTINKARKHGHDGAHRIGTPKTRAGMRTVRIDADLADMLREHVAGMAPSAPLFDLGNDGTWQRNYWTPAVNAAMLPGERPRVHDLRHSHASWMLANGEQLFAVSKRLGHADLGTTANIYGHLDTSADAGAADRLGEAMRAVRGPVLRVVH